MKKTSHLLLLLFLTICSLKTFSQTEANEKLFPACKTEDNCGFIDQAGKWFIQPKFVDTQDFSEELAAVSLKVKGAEKYGFIDRTGQTVIEPQFYKVWKFSDGLARFQMQEHGKYGFVDKSGKIVIEAILQRAESFSEGLARITVRINPNMGLNPRETVAYSGFINPKGEIVIPLKYETLSSFSEGLAVACVESGKCGYIDKKGEWKIKPEFLNAEPFSEGLAVVQVRRKDDDKHLVGDTRSNWGYINKNGEIVIEPKYYDPKPFSEGLAAIRLSSLGQYGYIDRTGKIVIPFQFYLHAGQFSEGLAAVCVDGGVDSAKYAYIDKTGKRTSEKTYSEAHPFKNGLAFVGKKNLLSKMDVSNFGGLAFSKTNYIDKTEKVIWNGKD